ncbi:DUF3750 domain-containing protein [Alteromonas ponticola]|uniref:DUF3750 domain-containing protein n=1 Tax=Alteromonas aquimaris TaxID=2998417 RepID=A0ABT3PA28_9ALTE|nr:DUF3750 domain-containing protein [Alteromonas aquimaris]MCW8109633.1 DUF3750 domain-containing protein [Alteromonas aquimaris]
MNLHIFVPTCLLLFFLSASSSDGWQTASREPAGIAPDPKEEKRAVVEVYAADAYGWKGVFAVHTWIALKEENADNYSLFEVVGWRVNRGGIALRQTTTITPDKYWYGAKPEKLLSVQGEKASQLIPKILNAIARYPWTNEYRVFPGPNSNTFPAWIAKEVPELGLELPFTAFGSGYADTLN